MLKVKIGFAPSNWDSWNGGNYAEAIRDRCVAVLQKIPGIDLVVPSKELTPIGCVSSIDDARKAAALFRGEDIQGLIIGNMDFGMEVAIGTLLNGTRKDMPILHFATRSAPYLPNGSRMTDTWCGQFMTTASLKRRGFTFEHLLTCNPEEDSFKEKLETFSRAVNAIARFKGARMGLLGTRPELFESENISEQALQRQFGQMVVPVDLFHVIKSIKAIDITSKQVTELAKDIARGATVLGEPGE